MTGPAREDWNEEPDTYGDGDLDEGPKDSIPPKRDAWDEEEGVPVDLEDIAIVCHEALRAYRSAQGGRPGFAWMHQTTNERKAMVDKVSAILNGIADPAEPDPSALGDDPETKLVVAITKSLAP